MVVGGRSPRAVVCTASYEARRFGAKSAMPMMAALRLCPDAVVVPPRMAHYADVSAQVMAILRRYSPEVEPLSLDEAFVDVTASRALFGDAPGIARRVRSEIREELALTASAGVATSKFLAKVASDLEKPDGLTVVEAGSEAAFLDPLPIERMWGVGPKASYELRRAGFRTIGDLARARRSDIEQRLGAWGRVVQELARGRDERAVVPRRDPVSVGAEETFEVDLRSREELERAVLAQATRVARRLTTQQLRARTVVLKLTDSDFTRITRHVTLPEAVCDTTSIYEAARALLDRVPLEVRAYRLVGVAAKELVRAGGGQASLFPDPTQGKRTKLEETLAEVRAKFGEDALVQATLRSRQPATTMRR